MKFKSLLAVLLSALLATNAISFAVFADNSADEQQTERQTDGFIEYLPLPKPSEQCFSLVVEGRGDGHGQTAGFRDGDRGTTDGTNITDNWSTDKPYSRPWDAEKLTGGTLQIWPAEIGTDIPAGLGVQRWSITGHNYAGNIKAADVVRVEVDYYYEASENAPGTGSDFVITINQLGNPGQWGGAGALLSANAVYTANEKIKANEVSTAVFDLTGFADITDADGVAVKDAAGEYINMFTLNMFKGAVGSLTDSDTMYLMDTRFYSEPVETKRTERTVTFKSSDYAYSNDLKWETYAAYALPDPTGDAYFADKEFLGWQASDGTLYQAGDRIDYYGEALEFTAQTKLIASEIYGIDELMPNNYVLSGCGGFLDSGAAEYGSDVEIANNAQAERDSSYAKVTKKADAIGDSTDGSMYLQRWSIFDNCAVSAVPANRMKYMTIEYRYDGKPLDKAQLVYRFRTLSANGYGDARTYINADFAADEYITPGSHIAKFDIRKLGDCTVNGIPVAALDDAYVPVESTLFVFKGAEGQVGADDAIYIKSVRFYDDNPSHDNYNIEFSVEGEPVLTETWSNYYTQKLPELNDAAKQILDEYNLGFIGWYSTADGKIYQPGDIYSFREGGVLTFEAEVYEKNPTDLPESINEWILSGGFGGVYSADGNFEYHGGADNNTCPVKYEYNTQNDIWGGEAGDSAAKFSIAENGKDVGNGIRLERWSVPFVENGILKKPLPSVGANSLRYMEVDYYYAASAEKPGEGTGFKFAIHQISQYPNVAPVGSYSNAEYESQQKIMPGAHTATFDLTAFPNTPTTDGNFAANMADDVVLNYMSLYAFCGAENRLTTDDALYIKEVRFYDSDPNAVRSSDKLSMEGIQIRTEGKQGLRFIAKINSDMTAEEYGIIALPTDLIDGKLSLDSENAAIIRSNADGFRIYCEANGYTEYTICITDILPQNYDRDISVRAYAIYDIDGTKVTVYSDMMTGNVLSTAEGLKKMDSEKYTALYDKIMSEYNVVKPEAE